MQLLGLAHLAAQQVPRQLAHRALVAPAALRDLLLRGHGVRVGRAATPGEGLLANCLEGDADPVCSGGEVGGGADKAAEGR